MDETRELTRFVVETTYDSLPADTIGLAKERLLDILGASVYATCGSWSKMVHDLVIERTGHTDCTLWGSSHRADPAGAALVNGTLAHGFELDDAYLPGSNHPGAVVVPAALVAGEQAGSSGRDLLTAVVLGYEVMGRVGVALGPRHIMRGHHPTGNSGVFGSTTAAGKLWGLSKKELLNAYGVAGSLASGINEFSQDPEGTMVKRLYGGRPAESGIVATGLARRGFTGPATVLEGRYGFLKVYSDAPALSALTDGLGKEFVIRGVLTKPYPSCGGLHCMVEAIGQVLGERGVDKVRPDDIQRVDLGFPLKTLEQNMVRNPRSIMSAQYSAPFTGALALIGRGGDPSAYTEENLTNPELSTFMEKFHAHQDADMDALYPKYRATKVRVTFADGTAKEASVHAPKGTPDHPFSPSELERRFDMLAGTVLSAGRCREVRETIANLESVRDVGQLARLLAA